MGGMIIIIITNATLRLLFSSLFFLFWIFVNNVFVTCVPTITTATTMQQTSVCTWRQCNCTNAGHKWIIASCFFDSSQAVDVTYGSLPYWLLELHIEGGGHVRLHADAFSSVHDPRLFNGTRIQHLVVRRHALWNTFATHVRLLVSECQLLVLESYSLRSVATPASLNVSRCGHVVVQSEAFYWTLGVHVASVPCLQLAPYAFYFGNNATSAVVVLDTVMLKELPAHVFPSVAAEIRLVRAHVRAVRGSAFSAVTVSLLAFEATTLQQVDAGAVSGRTLVGRLQLQGARVGLLAEDAITAGISSLAVEGCSIGEVQSGAIDINVANVSIRQSTFDIVRNGSLIFNNWNYIDIDNNTFGVLEGGAVSTPFHPVNAVNNHVFTFTDNRIVEMRPQSISFVTSTLSKSQSIDSGLSTHVANTVLSQQCHCDLSIWLHNVSILLESTKCAVDEILSRCLDLPRGSITLKNYTDLVCVQGDVIRCSEVSSTSDFSKDHDDDVDVSILSSTSTPDRERKVLAMIFLVVVLSMILILTVTAGLWLRNKGYFRRYLNFPTTSCVAMLFRFLGQSVGNATTTTAATTICQEYTELQQQQQHNMTIVDEMDEDEEEEEVVRLDDDDDETISEDKWTQTLPEELTQELLQQLREKLDDPDNYSEARDMIEHLYDLIKVEESSSGDDNHKRRRKRRGAEIDDDDDDDFRGGENVYDVIVQEPSTSSTKCKKSTTSVGTRVPSPDKLLPVTSCGGIPVVCEYVEPRDREQHVYTEVPGDRASTTAGKSSTTTTRRPLSFLRVLGQSLQFVSPAVTTPSSTSTSKPSLVCEYADPTDAAVHVYSELMGVAGGGGKGAARMANRPLPEKPWDGGE